MIQRRKRRSSNLLRRSTKNDMTTTQSKHKISDEFYDHLEAKYGDDISVIIEHESDSYYYIKVYSYLYAYCKEDNTWQLLS